ncbi:hypothetical protein E2C01_068531 [Portunus trituberculatus]|uniref:Uncharacterized protein n=1 Tax=Portunus trituberculatus TaxID=210409 RepID=A0A5B7HMM9_PORTR|nr:hypothetical protein [Portunus trituberculatus]
MFTPPPTGLLTPPGTCYTAATEPLQSSPARTSLLQPRLTAPPRAAPHVTTQGTVNISNTLDHYAYITPGHPLFAGNRKGSHI